MFRVAAGLTSGQAPTYSGRMPTPPRFPPAPPPAEPHRARAIAESFGSDPERYDRARPAYPQDLVDAVLADLAGRDVLDVGIGTGISARPFRAAGCRVLGVEVDPRMAAFARRDGFQVEVARFEDWEPGGRRFDAVIAGMTWHWVDPVAGARAALELLGENGRLAAFWNIGRPPADLARMFSDVYRRVLPGTPFAGTPSDPLAGYEPILTAAGQGIETVHGFAAPARWRWDWERDYTTEQWVDQVPTFGGHSRMPAATLERLLAGIAAAIESVGGSFLVSYATVAVTARRRGGHR